MRSFLLMVVAGGAGTAARYGLSLWLQNGAGARFDFPLGTLAVNVLGCLLLSAITTVALQRAAPEMRLILGTGFCGAFTTFSTFGVEADDLLRRAPASAFWYISGNLVLGLGAIWAGRWLALQLLGRAAS